jgi:putative inorganic carbon (HCO3(-)) transporter
MERTEPRVRPPSRLTVSGLALAALAAIAAARAAPGDFASVAIAVGAAAGVIVVGRIEPHVVLTLAIVLSVFSGHWDELGFPIGIDRVVMLAGIAGVFWQSARGSVELRIRPVHILLAAAALFACGSALWAATLTDSDAFYALADQFGLIPFLLFLVAPAVFGTERSRRTLLLALVALGAYLGVVALLEGIGAKGLVVPRYVADPFVGLAPERARGPFVAPEANGYAMFGCGVAAMIVIRTYRGLPRQCAACVVALCAMGIVFTLTRAVWLASAAGATAGFLATPGLRRWLLPAAASAAVAVVLMLVVLPGFSGHAGTRLQTALPVYDRLNSDRAALQMIDHRPLLGFGWSRFGDASPDYYTLAAGYPLTSVAVVHNVFLSYAVELGLLGVALWAAGFALAVGSALTVREPRLQPWRSGLVALVVAWLVIANFSPFFYAFPNYLVWLWAGVVTAGARA